MYAWGTRGAQVKDHMYDASGAITTGGTPQLVLPERRSTQWVTIQNISDTQMWLEFGSARATATIAGGQITGFTITNAGFGFTYPPTVTLFGGGFEGNSSFKGVGLPGYLAPGIAAVAPQARDPVGYHPGKAHAVLSGSTVGSIVIEDPGLGYAVAPFVLMENDLRDPYGCADPSLSGGTGLIMFSGGGAITIDSNFNTTDSIALFCTATGKRFTVKWAPS